MILYGFGIILNGFLADKANPKYFFIFGSIMGLLCYAALGILGLLDIYNVNVYFILFGAYGYFQSMVFYT